MNHALPADLAEPLGAATAGSLVVFALAAAVGLARRDNSVADVAWGPAIFVAALAGAAAAGESGARTMLAVALVGVWATRLALHIGRRKRHDAGEDPRYARWREQWNGRHVVARSLLQVFALQALLGVLVASCVCVIALAPEQGLDVVAVLGALVWAIGFGTEALADAQLQRFVARKRAGKASGFCEEGLWSRSRHPNYLGEAIAWWGVALIAVGAGLGGWTLLAFVAPVLVTVLVRFVSGVPILERAWRERAGFDVWAARVPVFLPRLRR